MLSDSVNLLGTDQRQLYIIIGLIGHAVAMLILPHTSIGRVAKLLYSNMFVSGRTPEAVLQ